MRFRVIDADTDIASGIPRLRRAGDPEVEIMMAPGGRLPAACECRNGMELPPSFRYHYGYRPS